MIKFIQVNRPFDCAIIAQAESEAGQVVLKTHNAAGNNDHLAPEGGTGWYFLQAGDSYRAKADEV